MASKIRSQEKKSTELPWLPLKVNSKHRFFIDLYKMDISEETSASNVIKIHLIKVEREERKMLTRSKTSARILVLILAVATVMAFTPLTGWTQEAYAEGEQTPADQVAVNGASVTTGEYWVWGGSSYTTTGANSSNYNIHYTAGNLELKDDDHFTSVAISSPPLGGQIKIVLNNAVINATGTAAILGENTNISLSLIGNNKITSVSPAQGVQLLGSGCGIKNDNGSLSISGSGRLDLNTDFNAITADSGLNISGGSIAAVAGLGATVGSTGGINIEGGNLNFYSDMDVALMGRSITISGGNVSTSGNGANCAGIYTSDEQGNESGSVTITGGAVYAYGSAYAIDTPSLVVDSEAAPITKAANNYTEMAILSDSTGYSTLMYALTIGSRYNYPFAVDGIRIPTGKLGIDLTKPYGDYSNAAVNGSHPYTWAVQETATENKVELNGAYFLTDGIDNADTVRNLSVTITGDNVIAPAYGNGNPEYVGLYSYNSVNFNGSGSLDVIAASDYAFECTGIEVRNGDIIVAGPSITASASIGNNDTSTGIFLSGTLTVNSGTVAATGADLTSATGIAFSVGIIAGKGIDASGGTVTGTAGSASTTMSGAPARSRGIVFSGSGAVMKGNITGKSGTASANGGEAVSCGIASENSPFTINGPSTIIAESADNTAYFTAPTIDSSLNVNVLAGSEAGGNNAAVVSEPVNETYTGSKYVKITTSSKQSFTLPLKPDVTSDMTGVSLKDETPAVSGTDYKGTINAEAGFSLPDKISITVGGKELTADQFTYDPVTGEFVIPGKYVNGAIVIKAAGSLTNASGISFTKSRLKYRITKPSTHVSTATSKSAAVRAAAVSTYGEVTVIGPVKKTYTELTVPSTVTLNGYVYKVRSISAKAFSSSANLESVTVGKYVRAINRSAFYKCSKLENVEFAGKNLTYIGKNAFSTCAQGCEFNVPASKFKAYKKLLLASGLPKGAEIVKVY